ncbi:MAG TPA: DUF2971 domain-containing protein [Pseudomonadales bacterium]|nr:DUF2971 domain-containing protein [Pseudomonadales bacterium]
MSQPDFLYKYRPLNAYSLASLLNNTMWLANPTTFNDPFDCAFSLDRGKYKQSVMHAISVAMERADQGGFKPEHLYDVWPGDEDAFEQLRENIKKTIENIGICSFSATPNHMLMWSHYADHHRGFCVQYDCREGTRLRRSAKKVDYKDSTPSLSASDFSPDKISDSIDILWLTKAECWSYEEEWRVINNEGSKTLKTPSEALSIIFGARMPESDRVMIRYALRHNKIVAFKEARLKEGHFTIEITEL